MSLISRPSRFVARRFQRLFGGPEGDRGIFAILAALVLTVMVFATALSVDIMGRVSTLRTDQATADMAVLDAAWELNQPTPTLAGAQTLACPNGLANGISCSNVTIAWGNASGLCTSACTNPTTVTATVSTVYHDWFGRSQSTLSRSAVAQIGYLQTTTPCTVSICYSSTVSEAQFSIGSTLAEVNAGLGRFGQANLSLIGYQGLTSGSIALGVLETDFGWSGLTPTGILNQTVTVGSLLNEYSSILNNNGDTAAGASLSALRTYLQANALSTFNGSFTLGQFLGITSGNGMTLGTTVSFLQMFNGALQVANGKAGISASLGITGIGTASVSAIEPPTVSPYGQPGVQATNTQVTATMSDSLLSLVPLTLTVNVGAATGTLSSIDGCGTTPSGIHVSTSFNAATIYVSGSVPLVANISGYITVPLTPGAGSNPISVPNTADFVPNSGVATVSGSQGSVVNNISVQLLGAAQITASTVLSDIPYASILSGLMSGTGVLANDGINIGNAAYQGIQATCGGTNQITSGTTTTATYAPELVK
ncbi:MAG TPA: hypothetical protein VHA57_04905 [Actinomycetota bacterium]|nr:hypothetical protein [Actinomycetota bacterium]